MFNVSVMANFHELATAFVDLNKNHRLPDDGRNDIPQFLRDHATVRINVGLRTGKTTWVGKSAKPGDLVLVRSALHVNEFPRTEGVTVASINDIHHIPRKRYSTVFMDDVSWAAQPTLDSVYTRLGVDHSQTFVMVG